MGIIGSKEMTHRRVDESTSNSSLSNLRYVIVDDKSKWKLFRKKNLTAIPAYQATSLRPTKGCPCGNNGPCKQKVTPKGVTIHYPQKKKKFRKFGQSKSYISPKSGKPFYGVNNVRPIPKVKVIRPSKFPTWRLSNISYRWNR